MCNEQVLASECYVQEFKDGERDIRVAELPTLNEQFLPLPKIIVHEIETRDERALKQGEVDEPLELITFDPTHLEARVRVETKMEREERQQLK